MAGRMIFCIRLPAISVIKHAVKMPITEPISTASRPESSELTIIGRMPNMSPEGFHVVPNRKLNKPICVMAGTPRTKIKTEISAMASTDIQAQRKNPPFKQALDWLACIHRFCQLFFSLLIMASL